MAEHTPGPWLLDNKTVYALDERGEVNRFSILLNDGFIVCSDFQRRRITEEEQRANARLIAAAPELATELAKALDDLWDDRHSHQDRPSFERDYASAFAALAKAGVA